MDITDKDGRWVVEGQCRYLVEPSASYLAALAAAPKLPERVNPTTVSDLKDALIKKGVLTATDIAVKEV